MEAYICLYPSYMLVKYYHRYLSGFYIWIALIVFTSLFTILRPDYNHINQSFSELGALNAPNYVLFNVLVFGGLGMASLYFIQQIIDYFGGTLSPLTYWSHRLAALSWIFTGIFPLSFEIKWLFNAHLAGAIMTYIFGGMTVTLYIRHFNRFPSGFTLFSLVSVWFLFGVWLVILLSTSVISREIAQLTAIVSFFTWQAIFSLILYQKVRKTDNS